MNLHTIGIDLRPYTFAQTKTQILLRLQWGGGPYIPILKSRGTNPIRVPSEGQKGLSPGVDAAMRCL